MYCTKVGGSYYEMGHKHGSALYRHGFRLPRQTHRAMEFGGESEHEVKRVFPKIEDELRGFADGCHARYEEFLAFTLTIGVEQTSSIMCSVFGASSSNGVIFGRNYDFFYKYGESAEHYLTTPEDGFASVGDSDVFIGREDGVNEKGLSVGISFVGPKTRRPGLNFPLAVRYALDSCSSVNEALRTFTKIRFSTTNNYLMADSSGDMTVVEASPARIRVRKPDGDHAFVVATNHFVHPEMAQFEDLGQRDPDSVKRYDAISNGIVRAGGKMTLGRAKSILADHDGGVCSHHDDIKLGTLWSTVANLSSKEILIAAGHPCEKEYQSEPFLKKIRHA